MDRQRYMAELSKLLAFMFKEDKEEILAQYNKMLDEAEDEQAMLDSFGSPTKLAVTISRTYDRTERKLAVNADSRENPPAAAPIPAAPQKKAESTAETAELSYADIIEEIRREKAAEEGIEYKPIFFNDPEPAPEPEPMPEPDSEPVSEPAEEVPEESGDTADDVEAPAQDSEEPEEAEEAEAGEEAPAEAETESAEAPAEEAEEETEKPAEAEDAADEPAEAEETEETVASDAEEDAGQEAPEADAEPTDGEGASDEESAPEVQAPAVRYKTNVPLLILYLIIAIPVGIALVAAAIIIGLVLLAVGAGLGAAGVKMIGFAFSAFVIFADVMLCSGVSLIVIAAALIVLWLGILMFAKGIGGIVGAVMALGRKFCVREVPENE